LVQKEIACTGLEIWATALAFIYYSVTSEKLFPRAVPETELWFEAKKNSERRLRVPHTLVIKTYQ